MRALVQRVSEASVRVDGECVGAIDHGMLVLLGVGPDDTEKTVDALLHRLLHYRIFADDAGRMNNNVQQEQGSLLIVSQFTLMADTAKGLRPGFSAAAKPELAEYLYEYLVQQAREQYQPDKVQTGRFAADMQVALVNDGPVTFMLEA